MGIACGGTRPYSALIVNYIHPLLIICLINYIDQLYTAPGAASSSTTAPVPAPAPLRPGERRGTRSRV